MDGTLSMAAAIVLGIAAIIMALVIIAKRRSDKEKQKIIQQLDDIAERHNLSVKYIELMRNKLIAMDEQKAHLVFIDNNRGLHHVLSISEITNVVIEKKGKGTKSGSQAFSLAAENLGSIALAISIKNAEVVSLPFYTDLYDGMLDAPGLNEKAEKWKAMISN